MIVSREFFDFLSNVGGIIPAIILNLPTKEDINYIAPSGKSDMVSYLPMNKFNSEQDPFNSKFRQSMKIGRLIYRLIPENHLKRHDVSDSQFEHFINQYKSFFDYSNFEIKVVNGEEIRKWYLDKNYFAPNGRQFGTLWNSCMRYSERQKFLDLYCLNPNVKMLVMTIKIDNKEYVRCRALLWDEVEVTKSSEELPKNIKVMDRIYSVFESDIIIFKRWAEENGYVPKWEQNSKSHQLFDVKGNAVVASVKLSLNKFMLQYYPYLDTFPFFNIEDGQFMNSEFSSWNYKLVQANGLLEREEEIDEDEVIEDWDD